MSVDLTVSVHNIAGLSEGFNTMSFPMQSSRSSQGINLTVEGGDNGFACLNGRHEDDEVRENF